MDQKQITQEASKVYQADKAGYKAMATKQIAATIKGDDAGVILLANRVKTYAAKEGSFDSVFTDIAAKGVRYGSLSSKQLNVLVKGLPYKAGFLGYQLARAEVSKRLWAAEKKASK